MFKLVDDIEGLGNLNSGVVAYEYLVGSISRASFLFKKGGTKRHFHVEMDVCICCRYEFCIYCLLYLNDVVISIDDYSYVL